MQRYLSEQRSSIRALGSAISTTMLSSCWLPSGLHTRSAWNARYEQLFVYDSPSRKWSNSGAEYPLQIDAASRDSSCWARIFQSQFVYHTTGRLSLQGQLMRISASAQRWNKWASWKQMTAACAQQPPGQPTGCELQPQGQPALQKTNAVLGD